MIDENKIASQVGLQTYIALYYRCPKLYKNINFPMIPKDYYVELVDACLTSTGLSFENACLAIRNDLVRLIDLPIDSSERNGYSPAKKLLNSSQLTERKRGTRIETGIFIVLTVIFSFVLVTLIMMSKLFHFDEDLDILSSVVKKFSKKHS